MGTKGLVLKTVDGGVHWQKLPTPMPDSRLSSVWFISPREGWITTYDGHIFYTSDGGISWQLDFENVTDHYPDKFIRRQLLGMLLAAVVHCYVCIDCLRPNKKSEKLAAGKSLESNHLSKCVPKSLVGYRCRETFGNSRVPGSVSARA